MNEFELNENKLLGITYDGFHTKTHFDTKAKANSEMANIAQTCASYWRIDELKAVNPQPLPATVLHVIVNYHCSTEMANPML